MPSKQVITKSEGQPGIQTDLWLDESNLPTSGNKHVKAYRFNAWKSYQKMLYPLKKDEIWKTTKIDDLPFKKINLAHKSARLCQPEFTISKGERESNFGVYSQLEDAIIEHPEIINKVIQRFSIPIIDKFSAMARAFGKIGTLLYFEKGDQREKPVQISMRSSGDSLGIFQHYLWLEPDSMATVIFTDEADDVDTSIHMNIGNTSILVGENASLTVIDLRMAGAHTWNILHEDAIIGENGNLEWVVCTVNNRFTKEFLRVDLAGKGANTTLTGLYLATEKQQLEFETRQSHNAPDTKSDLLYKGVLLDDSRTLFRGMIHVSPAAVKTDAYQVNRNLILGDKAHADSIPGLEILADDVRCSHGATVGSINEDELFYVQSRGVGLVDARRLIVEGFIDPVIQKIRDENARMDLQQKIELRLATGM